MWKPKNEGVYRRGNDILNVWMSKVGLMSRAGTHGTIKPVVECPWSLLAPEWQDGAPTVEQLSRWQWWALALKGDEYAQIICGKVSMSGDPQHFYIPSIKVAAVVKSAPVQPVPGEVLWVPLEVAE